ncbi:hypothetical protein N7509_014124 [Penicillium cosmopolitanum]|uniref:Haloacid dehalogenase, type II n=1 Tax=Penicillium cosmopolitanum TaxID=1131564 RepID=A0A9W9S0M6_9EURO|nr:uncharacterized protein N7509_014124 [Penicillium cosmopolitanum]KAJ5369512.1 hypothetical protein N7509_014124 [Penicillium cosmopolitanum]
MSKLSDYRLLSFDVYGTLVDWEGGIFHALQPTLAKNNAQFSRQHLLALYHELEREQQNKTPDMPYHELLTTVHPELCQRLGVWTLARIPDTVEALKRLSKKYKLVVLSNVDRASFAKTNAGSLQDFHFDLIITAQDVGSYKPDLRNFQTMLDAADSAFGIQPSEKMGIKSVWIERPGATMGNLPENIFDWRFDTLGDMADALDAGR